LTGPRSEACLGAVAKLNWEFYLARRCDVDSDCSYIDEDFTVLPHAEVNREITVSVCGDAAPLLIVANPKRLPPRLGRLQRRMKIQAQACAEPPELTEPGYECTRHTRAMPAGPPVCTQGQCTTAPWR
jgi:hypothetical protein